jgi:aspartokinase
LRICNSRAPHEEGTLISMTTSVSPGVIKSIAYQPGLETDPGCAMISLIGEGLHADEGIAARALEALGDMSILPVVRNGSSSSLSFVIEEERSVVAVKRLHQVFFEESEDDFTTVLPLDDVFSESERLRHEGRVVVEIAARHEATGPELERFAWELRESISLID